MWVPLYIIVSCAEEVYNNNNNMSKLLPKKKILLVVMPDYTYICFAFALYTPNTVSKFRFCAHLKYWAVMLFILVLGIPMFLVSKQKLFVYLSQKYIIFFCKNKTFISFIELSFQEEFVMQTIIKELNLLKLCTLCMCVIL